VKLAAWVTSEFFGTFPLVWGGVPFQVNGAGWWTVYIVAPVVGGLLGGGIYAACFKRAHEQSAGAEAGPATG